MTDMTEYHTSGKAIPGHQLAGLADTPPHVMATHFREAKVVLELDGHTKGLFTDSCGQHCAIGALMAARRIVDPFFLPNWDRELVMLADIVGDPDGRYNGAPLLMVAGWNDRDETTPQDVIDLFEAAEARAEALAQQ